MIFQRDIVRHGVGQQPLQFGVLVFQCPQALGRRDIHPAERGLPLVDARVTETELAAQVGNRNARLMLL